MLTHDNAPTYLSKVVKERFLVENYYPTSRSRPFVCLINTSRLSMIYTYGYNTFWKGIHTFLERWTKCVYGEVDTFFLRTNKWHSVCALFLIQIITYHILSYLKCFMRQIISLNLTKIQIRTYIIIIFVIVNFFTLNCMYSKIYIFVNVCLPGFKICIISWLTLVFFHQHWPIRINSKPVLWLLYLRSVSTASLQVLRRL